jgi:cellulose biosynthesis protein BcsQ
MAIPVLTFFNNKGGVGKTSLVYHLAWMLSDLGYNVLACDLDPQANLTSAFLDEERLEALWDEAVTSASANATIFECIKPLMRVGDLQYPVLQRVNPQDMFDGKVYLIPGDLSLAGFEDTLATEWPNALGSSNLYRPFRILTAFSTIMQHAASQADAKIILADIGPNLGAINRSALIATDYVVVPLGADLFSLQGLRNLGPTLRRWRLDWQSRRANWGIPDFPLPRGVMRPVGYVVQQHGVRLRRPVRAYDKWVNRIPKEYASNLLDDADGPYSATPQEDVQNALATMKHYRSLVPMAQEHRKPIFKLTPADGAFGSHAAAVKDARTDFRELAEKIIRRIGLTKN